MKKLILVVFIVLLTGCGKPLPTDVVVLQKDVVRLDKKVALLEEDVRVEKEKLIILSCESKFRHDNMWGDHGKSYGIAQFQQRTFDELKTRAGKKNLSWGSQADQLWLLDWAIRNGYAKEWTCASINKK